MARSHRGTYLLLAIVIFGAVLRFMQVGQIRYGYDQSYPAYQALALLDNGEWPLIGQPSSVFLDNPALMAYIQALPLLVWRSPIAVQLFILALNTAAIWFVYRVGTDTLGNNDVGLVAAFLFAFNPWVVFFSRTTWVQALMPLFMVLIAWGLWPSWIDGRGSSRRFFAGGAAVTLMTQTYIAAWGVLPQLALLLIAFRRRTPRRAFIAALIVFVLAAALFGFGLLTRQEVNADKASGFLAAGWRLSSIGFRHTLRFVNGIDFRPAYAAGNPVGAFWPLLSSLAVLLLTFALLAGILRAVAALRTEGPQQRAAAILLVWLFTPAVLTLAFSGNNVHPHYLLLSLPAGQLLAAWGVLTPSLRHAKTLVAAVIVLVAFTFAHDLYRANQLVAREPTRPAFDGWSLAAGAKVGSIIRDQVTAQPGEYPRRLVMDSHRALASGLSATYLLPIAGISYPDFIALSGDEPLAYVIEGSDIHTGWLAPWFESSGDAPLTFAGGEEVRLAVARAASSASLDDYVDAQVNWRSDAGLTLVGYSLTGETLPGNVLELVTVWRVDDLHPDRAGWYVAGNVHLVDQDGNLIGNFGEHGQWARRWLLGDVYIERLSVPLPVTPATGQYHLSIGLTDSIRGVDYHFSSPDAVAGRLEIPLSGEVD